MMRRSWRTTVLVTLILSPFLGVVPIAPVAYAQSESDFTFKRVKPGARKAGKFISIQITEPPAPTAVLARRPDIKLDRKTAVAPAVETKTLPADGWFWSALSPSLAAARPGRLAEASRVLESEASAASSLAPPLSRLQQITERYGAEIMKATAGTRISPALALAVISVESAGKPAARSSAGAVGLMQLMPATAKRFGVTDRTDAAQSLKGGIKYLSWLLDEFGGDAVLALAGYNAGEGAVRKNNGVPNYKETRNYVPKVVAAWQVARSLCLTPPNRATDGCVFVGMRLAQK